MGDKITETAVLPAFGRVAKAYWQPKWKCWKVGPIDIEDDIVDIGDVVKPLRCKVAAIVEKVPILREGAYWIHLFITKQDAVDYFLANGHRTKGKNWFYSIQLDKGKQPSIFVEDGKWQDSSGWDFEKEELMELLTKEVI